jgi:hypothetical protein
MADWKNHKPSARLLAKIKDRIDDINAIWIVFDNKVKINRLDGSQDKLGGVAGVVHLCDGSTLMLHSVDLENLLNDQAIRRVQIPFRLWLPGHAPPDQISDLGFPREEE